MKRILFVFACVLMLIPAANAAGRNAADEIFNSMVDVLAGNYDTLLRQQNTLVAQKLWKTYEKKTVKPGVIKAADEAIAGINETLAKEPDNVQALTQKGYTLIAGEKLQDALDCFNRVLVLEPENDEIWSMKSALLIVLDNITEAEWAVNKALDINPDNPASLATKGLVLLAKRNYDDAADCFDRSYEIRPSVYTMELRTAALLELERYGETVECLDILLKSKPKAAEYWTIKGYSLAKMDYNFEALNCFNKSIKYKSKLPETWELRADVLAKLDRQGEAAESLMKAEIMKFTAQKTREKEEAKATEPSANL